MWVISCHPEAIGVLERITYPTFAGREGERFVVRIDDEASLSVELESVTNHGPPGPRNESATLAGGGESFSLVFRFPPTPMLAQATYLFEHDELGTFPIFIVPVGAKPDGLRYEAVFNRPPPPRASAP